MAKTPSKKPAKKMAVGGAAGKAVNENIRMGASVPAPKYSAFSWKGLTSNDPANVIRNRNAAAMYRNIGLPTSSNDRSPLNSALSVAATPNTATPTTVMKRTYVGGPPAGYDPSKSGEWSYFKTERVAAATPTEKKAKGGAMRGCGCAQRGTKKGKMV